MTEAKIGNLYMKIEAPTNFHDNFLDLTLPKSKKKKEGKDLSETMPKQTEEPSEE